MRFIPEIRRFVPLFRPGRFVVVGQGTKERALGQNLALSQP
jgi:hypothetical protein